MLKIKINNKINDMKILNYQNSAQSIKKVNF
jgi:hypothetical protein